MTTRAFFTQGKRSAARAEAKRLADAVARLAEAARPKQPRPSRDPERQGRIVHAYTVQHLTCQQIGALEGITRSAVAKSLQSAGVPSTSGTWVQTVCYQCRKPLTVRRGDWRNRERTFCSRACYFESRTNPRYVQNRHGQRLARITVRRAGFPLLKSHVVHHWDGNNRNNALNNLAVFATQREHMKFHHHGAADPIWDGRLVQAQ